MSDPVVVVVTPPAVVGVVVSPPPAVGVVVTPGQGPAGPPGPTGATGPAGAGGARYVHTQSGAATPWIVNHNLGVRPVIDIVDAGGSQVLAEILHVSANQANVYFAIPATGQAICV